MWFCPKCKILIEDNFNACWQCNTIKDNESETEGESEDKPKTTTTTRPVTNVEFSPKKNDLLLPRESTEDKYPALSIISGVYNIMAWIAGIITIFAAFAASAKAENYNQNGFLAFIIVALIGSIGVITLRALSEVILLFIDIEKNTRKK